MNKFLKVFSVFLGSIGGILIYISLGTSDFYIIECDKAEPVFIWPILIVGFIMTITACFITFFNSGDE